MCALSCGALAASVATPFATWRLPSLLCRPVPTQRHSENARRACPLRPRARHTDAVKGARPHAGGGACAGTCWTSACRAGGRRCALPLTAGSCLKGRHAVHYGAEAAAVRGCHHNGPWRLLLLLRPGAGKAAPWLDRDHRDHLVSGWSNQLGGWGLLGLDASAYSTILFPSTIHNSVQLRCAKRCPVLDTMDACQSNYLKSADAA